MSLERALKRGKKIRALGIDDAPFTPRSVEAQTDFHHTDVNVVGVVCSDTRFEGMLWNQVKRDGKDATKVLIEMIKNSKFKEQLHLILLDGIALGGFNVVDILRLSSELALPCIAVMRRYPDLVAVDEALQTFPDYQRRADTIEKAGPIYESGGFVFQIAGCSTEVAEEALIRLTDCGKVPEALRLAHLIGSAVKKGESSKRA